MLLFRMVENMAIDVAHDGVAAAAKFGLNAYDVVVLDRDLPGIHGDTLCQMVTERDDRATVLMLTSPGRPTTGSAVPPSAPTTTSSSPSTSRG